ncbi:MAG: SpoIID/LytB domain-containing protein [Candidatus Sumerlaeaceae bacterium]|nr:SpoIID/LytB domain-containing protein [Candidatus Sumerlaeaceae bacterium]
MTRLDYSNDLGPAVRIGVLQNEKEIKLTLRGRYRVVPGGAVLEPGTDVVCRLEDGRPAPLQFRLVLKKSPDRAAAETVTSPASSLEPLETIRLGFDFGPQASSVEYWRCSRPFASRAEAEAARARVPDSARIGILAEALGRPSGRVKAEVAGLTLEGADGVLRLEPEDPDGDRCIIHEVIVGIEYHWRHVERQRFRGVVEVRVDNAGLLTAISELPAEAYLFSVNSSEMMSVMPEELLKAQTVAARNTLFATMGKHHYADAFDLCADDHCQCYRGSSRETPDSRRVTLLTRGEVLVHDGAICDCRYSKMCGGLMEAFESVWNEDPRGYLPAGVDAPAGAATHALFPADTEERAAAYINSRPDCWCNTTSGEVPPYLTYSAPYFRWEVRYGRAEAEEMISKHLGAPIGELKALIPLRRGRSGRIEYMKIVASNGEWTIGKELAIRKALSRTCLYSTAFLVDYERAADGSIETVILRGAGWGHGSGLCQIGATMMAWKGKDYKEILDHYYPHSTLQALAGPVAPDRFETVVARQEARAGERCYEYYNCYAVARCPVYLAGVSLEAQTDGGPGLEFRQTQPGAVMDLQGRAIACEFLAFDGPVARPKS